MIKYVKNPISDLIAFLTQASKRRKTLKKGSPEKLPTTYKEIGRAHV